MGVEEVRGHLGTVLVWVEVVWVLGLVTDLILHILEAFLEVMEIEVIKEGEGIIEDILGEMEIEVSKVEAMEIEVTREEAAMIEVSMEEEIMTEDFMGAMVIEATLVTMIEVIKATMIEVTQARVKICPTEAAVYWVPRPL